MPVAMLQGTLSLLLIAHGAMALPQGVMYQIVTLAGNATAGYVDGQGSAATFSGPRGVAVSPIDGTVYVADSGSHVIRAVTPDGLVSTLAGNATPGFDDGQGSVARFYSPPLPFLRCGGVAHRQYGLRG